MTPSVVVAVVSWNTREHLARCLGSLQDADAEVWVADNASSDGSPELVRREFPAVRLLELGRNAGYGAAVNAVAARTGSHWIAAANADIALEPSALDALLAAGARDRDAAILAPRLVGPGGEVQHSVHRFPTLATAAAHQLGLPRIVPGLGDRLLLERRWDPERARRVDWALGAFLLIRRDAWEAIGGFDEALWLYAEDVDLCWRAARQSWWARYEPAATVRHHGAAATAQAYGEERVERWTRASAVWLARRRGRRYASAYAAVNLAGAGARAAWLHAGAAVHPDRYAGARDAHRGWPTLHRIALSATCSVGDRPVRCDDRADQPPRTSR